MGWYQPTKLQLSSVYGVYRGARGGGRIHAAARRYGYDQLILQALRIRLRYPLGYPDIDRYIDQLVYSRDRLSMWDRFVNEIANAPLYDPAAVTFRRCNNDNNS